MRLLNPRKTAMLVAAVGAAALVGGCGRTLLFAESDGVNFAVRMNPNASDTPVEVNFGLNRTVGTVVPPAGQADGKPKGEGVNMFAGFEVTNNLDPNLKKIDADLTIDTQFASGKAAKEVAKDPEVVAQIVNLSPVPYATSGSAKQLREWLSPKGKFSKPRFDKLQGWLDKRYLPKKKVIPFQLTAYGADEYEADRIAALKDKDLIGTPE